MGSKHRLIASIENLLDDDLREFFEADDIRAEVVVLVQILRELKKEAPEEKSKRVFGFGGTDASEPYHRF